MTRVCPRNHNHKTFYTTVRTTELWLVDDEGEFIDTVDGHVYDCEGPDSDNIWECATCHTTETKEKPDG